VKYCSICGKWKPLTEFSKDKSRKDGFNYYCKGCMKKRRQKYREKKRETDRKYYLNNKEKIKKRVRKYQSKRMGDVKMRKFLYDKLSGFLMGDGCCMWCFKINPFKLHNHHIWGRKNSDELFTFCANHHVIFGTSNNGPRSLIFEFLADW